MADWVRVSDEHIVNLDIAEGVASTDGIPHTICFRGGKMQVAIHEDYREALKNHLEARIAQAQADYKVFEDAG